MKYIDNIFILLSFLFIMTILLYECDQVRAQVVEANGNSVNLKIDSDKILFTILFFNSAPVLIDVPATAFHHATMEAFAGMVQNNGQEAWRGVHVTLECNAKWADETLRDNSGGMKFHFRVSDFSVWKNQPGNLGNYTQIHNVFQLKHIESTFADIGLVPPLPVKGRLVIGPITEGHKQNEGSDWIIDTSDVAPNGGFRVKFQPITRDEYRPN